mgnify:CR=1 FL=1
MILTKEEVMNNPKNTDEIYKKYTEIFEIFKKSNDKIKELRKNKKELSEEHCKKISDSTFGKHRSISDDKIREILKEKTSELTQKEIADKHSLSLFGL